MSTGLLAAIIGQPGAGGGGYDADAQAWFDALTAAGSGISTGNADAYNALVVGLKADASMVGGVSNWDAIKQLLVWCAADDLDGIQVPAKGTAATFGTAFDATSYSITEGITTPGSDSNRDVNTNRANNIDPQNNRSNFVWVTTESTVTSSRYWSAGSGSTNEVIIGSGASNANPRLRFGSTTLDTYTATTGTGLLGASRVASGNYDVTAWGADSNITRTSATPSSGNVYVFSTGSGRFIGTTISVYGAGEAVNLTNLRTRLATFMAALT